MLLTNVYLKSTTSNLLRDIITIFYAPLAQVYKAASVGDSLGDLQSFIDDLIRTVESVDQGAGVPCRPVLSREKPIRLELLRFRVVLLVMEHRPAKR